MTKPSQFTDRKSPLTGKPYPRCQKTRDGQQCNKAQYAGGYCYKHYQKSETKQHGEID